MKLFHIHITKICFALCILLFSSLWSISLFGQTNSNPDGFENNSIGDWDGGGWRESINIETTNIRTGTYALRLSTTSTWANRYWYTNDPYGASAVGTYVHFIYWAKASAASTSVNASMRYRDYTPPTGIGVLTTGSVVALSTGSWTRVTHSAGGVDNQWYYPSPRKTTSNATSFYIDDIIIYTSSSSTTDIIEPSSPTTLTGDDTNGLAWTDGADAGTGATGIQSTLIFKRSAGTNGSNDLDLNNQAIYSLTSTEGPSVVGNWTLIDPAIAAGTTAYTSGTFTVGEEYAVIHRDLAYNYSDPNYVVIATSTLANLTTEATSSITINSATGNGTITYEGDGVTESGICWNTTGTPTIGDNLTIDGPLSAQIYTGAIAGLTPNTLYYVRAYATTGGGTNYGNEVSFPTVPNPPTVGSGTDTTAVSFIAKWTAPTAQGTATFTYHVEVTETSGDYTTLAADVSGINSSNLSQIVSGLSPTTDYYYRVRAENASGESSWSGESVAVTTLTQSTLTVIISPTAAGTVTGDTIIAMNDGVAESFTTGEDVTLTATPAANYGFIRWLEGLNRYNGNPYDINVAENKTVTAVFGLLSCASYDLEDVTSGNISIAGYETTSFPSGGETWSTIDGRLNQSMAYAHDGSSQSIQLYYATGALITPVVARPTSISFWAMMNSLAVSTTVEVYVSTDGGSTYNPSPILSETVTVGGAWHQFTVDTAFTSNTVCFKILNSTGNHTDYNISVDDIDICESPDGIPPTFIFNPENGATEVSLSTNLTVTPDEKLYRYIASTGALLELTVGDPAFSNPDTLATFITLTRVSDNADIPFAANVDASSKIFINPSSDFDYYTEYKLSIIGLGDSLGNILSSTQYSQFITILPPSPIIELKTKVTNIEYDNGSNYNFGTIYSAGTITKTFNLINVGTDPLSISSCSLTTGSEYAISTAPNATVDPGDTTTIEIKFTPPSIGLYSDTLTIISNDIANGTYKVYLDGIMADFVLTYTYESGCTEPVYNSTEFTHDYGQLADIPHNITRKNGEDILSAQLYPSYTVFQSEGNCMPSGSSAIKVGQDTMGLQIALPNCGQVTVKWCSNGYRKAKISDSDNNVYEKSATYLPSNTCYTTSTVINTPDSIYLNIEFIGNDSALLTTVYYLEITPYSPSLLSSGRSIVDFSTGVAGEKVRIYDDIVLVTVPTGTDLANITPTVVDVSPFASVNPGAGDLQDFSSGAITYTVTAQDGLTKDYTVRVEYEVAYTGLYSDTIAITVDMDRADKTIELVEVTNSTCEVPVSGNGSDYTIYFLDPTDMPAEGYEIVGPSLICIGTVAEYTLKNAVETNNPSYAWNITGTAKDLFTIIGDTISDVLRLKAPNEMVEGTIDFSVIVEFDPSKCLFLRGEDDVQIGVTDQPPAVISGVTAGCSEGGLLEVTADGSPDATSFNWEFTPFTTVVSQDNNSILLNIGDVTHDISAKVNTQNGCGITIDENEYDLPYAKDWTKWTGIVDNDWDRNDNWTDRVPKSCTDVVIPDVGAGVEYPIIQGASGECHYITFESGGAVLGLEKLDYVRAYVEMQSQRDKWYTLTAPLKNMYSADYAFQGTPVTKMKLFDQINPDSISTGGVLNTGTWTRSFFNGEVELTPGMGYAFWVDQRTYNFPNAITFETADLDFYFPRETSPDNLMTLQYHFSTYSGRLLTDYPINLPRDSTIAYRFAMEDTLNVLQDFKVYIEPGLNLIGNPLMTHLDFTALYADNTGVISNKVKFWNGTTFTTYMSGSDISSDLDLSSTSIAPMQSFFVEKAAVPTVDSMLFDLDAHYMVDLTTKLRSAGIRPNTMHVKTNNGQYQSSTAIAMRPNAENSFENYDAFKLFTQFTDVPEVYTLADDIALDINQFDNLPYIVPLGLKTDKLGNVTYSFAGAESFNDVDVSLLNTSTGEKQNLKANQQYTLDYQGINPGDYLFVEFRNAEVPTTNNIEYETCTQCIHVFQKDLETIGVVSPESDKIDNITVWEASGKMMYSKFKVNNSKHDITVNPHQSCVIRVATRNSTYVVKLLMK